MITLKFQKSHRIDGKRWTASKIKRALADKSTPRNKADNLWINGSTEASISHDGECHIFYVDGSRITLE